MHGSTLLIGYGNPGRGDDGLGPAFARRIDSHRLPDLTVEIDYQLTVDHALMIASAETVIFADAAVDADSPFYFRLLGETAACSLDSHSLSPQSALSLSRLLFGTAARGFIMGLRGETFGEMAEGLSEAALASLTCAEAYFLEWYAQGRPYSA
ncbi:MAG: hydrogenase maturation protease [Hyphomicrobiales bacterium]